MQAFIRPKKGEPFPRPVQDIGVPLSDRKTTISPYTMAKPIPEGNFPMVAKTFYGLEEVLAEELRALGAMRVTPARRAVSFYGDTGFLYKANLCLRTALSVLVPIKTDKVFNETQLYKSVYNIPWERYLSARDTLAVDATVASQVFTNSHYVTLKVKDAIVDRIRDKMNARPDIDREDPSLRVNVHLADRTLTLSLDSSLGLHKRGYRAATNIAPINEVLAAGLLLLSGWKGLTNLMDPMCGSGTILIEAAMIAANIPACIHKKRFGFESWNDFDPELFEKIKTVSLKKMRDPDIAILGRDKAPSAIAKTIENITNAGLDDFIKVSRQDFFHSRRPENGRWTLLFNPPYGQRLEIDERDFYKKVGDTLKTNYPDTEAWMITASKEGLKSIGLRTSRSIPLMNANLESRLVKYELYTGSRRAPKSDGSSQDSDTAQQPPSAPTTA